MPGLFAFSADSPDEYASGNSPDPSVQPDRWLTRKVRVAVRWSGPKLLLHLEGGTVLLAAFAAFRVIGGQWTTFLLLFLTPDISMLGYLVSPRTGAIAYNAFHTYCGPFGLWLLAYFYHRPVLMSFSLIWLGHIGFDRMMGYGLKYSSGFKDTHFGRL